MKINRSKSKSTSEGFSLVEMLVSLSLFTVVLTMSISTLLVLIEANGRAQNMQLVMTNLSFALDSMTRETRTSTDWFCGSTGATQPTIPTDDGSLDAATSDCNSGDYLSIIESGSSLTSSYGTKRITYWFDPNAHATGHGGLKRKLGGFNGAEGSWVTITGSDIDLNDVRMIVTGTDRYVTQADETQPTATFYIQGMAGLDANGVAGANAKTFSIQTTVTQRLLDL